MKAIYGKIEHLYCEPVAEALAERAEFAMFFLQRAGCADWANEFLCLKREQASLRSSGRYWWKNAFCSESRCRCPNLSGREIDILAVFQRPDGARLGMHIECKHPGDHFSPGQAARYRERLRCWTVAGRGPRTIPRHEKAVALLICDRGNRFASSDLDCFDGIIYFDEIARFLESYPAGPHYPDKEQTA